MARRNLLAEAQVQAAAEVAPQVAALGEALKQARHDRNAAIHAAVASSAGIQRRIKQGRGEVKSGYKGAQALAAPPQSYQSDAYRQYAGKEQALGTTALASSLGNALKEMSDRRISAAAGRAYAVGRANADYQGAAAKVSSQRQSLAAQQGLLTGSIFSKLTEAQAGRNFTAHQNALQRDFQAAQSASDHAFTAHENALGRRSDRITAGINARSDADTLAATQKFTAGQNAANRKNARTIAGMNKGGGLTPNQVAVAGQKHTALVTDPLDAVTTRILADKGRKSQHDIRQSLLKDKKAPVPVALVNAAMDLAYNGYLSPPNRQTVGSMLRAHGVSEIPKRYLPVTVKAHTRKRRSK